VTSATFVNVTGTYAQTQTAGITIDPPMLSTVALNPDAILGGSSLVGTATLTGPAPAGGALVSLSADNPVSTGLQTVTSPTAIPQDGSVTWSDLGPMFTAVPSGTVVPITGQPGSTVTVSTATGQSLMVLASCPTPVGGCGFWGNFVPAEPLLWVSGVYNGTWTGNGPMTLALNTPQRGLGFRIMADEAGPFTGTVCAYNAADALLGCVPFTGVGAPIANGSNDMAVFVGLYDDTADISKVTVDAGGANYPHDFAIAQLSVASSRRMVPSSVKVQAGATTATFPVNTDTVTAITPVTVTGNYLVQHTGALTVNPALTSLSVDPSSVEGGTSANGTVTLGTPAPSGGAVVALSSDNLAATVPVNVTVPDGTTTASFTITTSSVVASTSATISATYGGAMQAAALSINPPALSSSFASPTISFGEVSSTPTGSAPAADATVAPSSSSASLTAPANVTVVPNSTATVAATTTAATFMAPSISVSAANPVTGAAASSGLTSTSTLAVNPPELASLTVDSTTVSSGAFFTGTVTLDAPAPAGGTLVTLSDDCAFTATPASVTVPAGATGATFTVASTSVAATTSLTVTATLNGVTKTATLTLDPPQVASFTLTPATVVDGVAHSTATITLTAAATGSTTQRQVTLSNSNPTALTVPATVTVPVGATTATFTVTSKAVAATPTSAISATIYGGTKTAALNVAP
jgi:hypothetical protein